MPMLGVTTGAAPTPSQSQETDMFRSTLTKVMCPAKWSTVAFADSVMRSMNSSFPMLHMLAEPGMVWIMALPTRPSAQPMPMFLHEPPNPPWVWPLKCVSTKSESYLVMWLPMLMWSNHLPPATGRSTVPSSSRMSTGQKVQPLTSSVFLWSAVV